MPAFNEIDETPPTAEELAYSQIRYPARPLQPVNWDMLNSGMNVMGNVLRQMGYSEMRKGQDNVVHNIMAGRDTLCVLPTNSGKTGCFIIPTLALGWRTLVFSPILALMRDQVQKCWGWGIAAGQMSSNQNDGENLDIARRWKNGELSLLYVSPERLNNPVFQEVIQARHPDMVTVDETHCHRGCAAVLTNKGKTTFNQLWKLQTLGLELPSVWCQAADGRREYCQIEKIFQNPATDLIDIGIDDCGLLITTRTHRVFTEQGEKCAGDLLTGDRLVMNSEGRRNASFYGTVEFVYPSERNCELYLYDMEVADNHNYFVYTTYRGSSRMRKKPTIFSVLVHNCLSSWSDSFRPAYCRIGDFIHAFKPKVVTAFTATCPPEVEEDARRVLCMQNASKLTFYPRRKNLKLTSSSMEKDEDEEYLIPEFATRNKGSGIVYCSSIRKVEIIHRLLNHTLGEEIGIYHGKLASPVKRVQQDSFMKGHTRIMVATNAFGMGVDHATIRFICYHSIPGSLEELAQGVGRAGRDGLDSNCHVYFSRYGFSTQNWFIACQYPSESDIRRIYNALLKLRTTGDIVQASYEEIGRIAGTKEGPVGSVLTNLRAANVIENLRGGSRVIKFKFLDDAEAENDIKYQEYKALIQDLGVMNDQALLEVDLESFDGQVDVQRQTYMKHLRGFAEKKWIYVDMPSRSPEMRILGGLERVEFARLDEKATNARAKLKQVLKYNEIPDAGKHAYLEKYFGVDNGD